MNKFRLLNTLRKNGDSVITFKDTYESILCTTDFKTKYVKNIRRKYIPNYGANILLFSWTDNAYRLIDPELITTVTALATILQNKENTLYVQEND